MKAIATVPGSKVVELIDRPEPQISAPDEVKIKIVKIGICGTDREIANGGRADAPAGETKLVIGHEMFGTIIQVGSSVTKFKVGDSGVFIVRRGCGTCFPCNNHRSDMCETGNYTERGIKMRDGYMTEFVVDKEEFLVKVPEGIRDIGVLAEPTSVSVKAIDEAVIVQAARIPGEKYDTYLQGKTVLVAGLGPIGLLAVVTLRLRGANVIGLDIVDETSVRPTVLKELGGKYVDGRIVKTDQLDDTIGQVDMIIEATGVAQLEFDLIDALGVNGVYVMTGIPAADRTVSFVGGAMLQQIVLHNQVIMGSVNASVRHFEMALQDLEEGRKRFGATMDKIITHVFPYTNFQDALNAKSSDEIKTVLSFE